MNPFARHPLREDGPFAIETACHAIEETYRVSFTNFVVVYADNCRASHCIWMVPGTFEVPQ